MVPQESQSLILLTDCAMYNVTVGSIHPSVICVEISNLLPSLESLRELLTSEYIEEGLQEFIENFARTDEVMPTDKTVGFVVVNSNKKVISLSFSSINDEIRDGLKSASATFNEIGYRSELDLP